MNQDDLILACMAASRGKPYSPVQIQKLVFLFQEKAPDVFDAKPFQFRAYDYGPFSRQVYDTLERFEERDMIAISGQPYETRRTYQLLPSGEDKAKFALNAIPEPERSFLIELSAWVRQQSFADLVGAVYREYPEMRENSVFGKQ